MIIMLVLTVIMIYAHDDNALIRMSLRLRPDEKAKLCLAMAYSVHSLYYMLLKAKVGPTSSSLSSSSSSSSSLLLILHLSSKQGVSPKAHVVRKELEKVQNYMKRLQAHQTAPAQRTLVVDTAASKRLVNAALQGNSEEENPSKSPASKRKLDEGGSGSQIGKDSGSSGKSSSSSGSTKRQKGS